MAAFLQAHPQLRPHAGTTPTTHRVLLLACQRAYEALSRAAAHGTDKDAPPGLVPGDGGGDDEGSEEAWRARALVRQTKSHVARLHRWLEGALRRPGGALLAPGECVGLFGEIRQLHESRHALLQALASDSPTDGEPSPAAELSALGSGLAELSRLACELSHGALVGTWAAMHAMLAAQGPAWGEPRPGDSLQGSALDGPLAQLGTLWLWFREATPVLALLADTQAEHPLPGPSCAKARDYAAAYFEHWASAFAAWAGLWDSATERVLGRAEEAHRSPARPAAACATMVAVLGRWLQGRLLLEPRLAPAYAHARHACASDQVLPPPWSCPLDVAQDLLAVFEERLVPVWQRLAPSDKSASPREPLPGAALPPDALPRLHVLYTLAGPAGPGLAAPTCALVAHLDDMAWLARRGTTAPLAAAARTHGPVVALEALAALATDLLSRASATLAAAEDRRLSGGALLLLPADLLGPVFAPPTGPSPLEPALFRLEQVPLEPPGCMDTLRFGRPRPANLAQAVTQAADEAWRALDAARADGLGLAQACFRRAEAVAAAHAAARAAGLHLAAGAAPADGLLDEVGASVALVWAAAGLAALAQSSAGSLLALLGALDARPWPVLEPALLDAAAAESAPERDPVLRLARWLARTGRLLQRRTGRPPANAAHLFCRELQHLCTHTAQAAHHSLGAAVCLAAQRTRLWAHERPPCSGDTDSPWRRARALLDDHLDGHTALALRTALIFAAQARQAYAITRAVDAWAAAVPPAAPGVLAAQDLFSATPLRGSSAAPRRHQSLRQAAEACALGPGPLDLPGDARPTDRRCSCTAGVPRPEAGPGDWRDLLRLPLARDGSAPGEGSPLGPLAEEAGALADWLAGCYPWLGHRGECTRDHGPPSTPRDPALDTLRAQAAGPLLRAVARSWTTPAPLARAAPLWPPLRSWSLAQANAALAEAALAAAGLGPGHAWAALCRVLERARPAGVLAVETKGRL